MLGRLAPPFSFWVDIQPRILSTVRCRHTGTSRVIWDGRRWLVMKWSLLIVYLRRRRRLVIECFRVEVNLLVCKMFNGRDTTEKLKFNLLLFILVASGEYFAWCFWIFHSSTKNPDTCKSKCTLHIYLGYGEVETVGEIFLFVSPFFEMIWML